jgi:hypothetical protein
MSKKEEIPQTNAQEITTLIERVKSDKLSAGDRDLLARLLSLMIMLLRMVEAKNTTISKLKKLLFGPKREKQAREQEKQSREGENKAAGASEEKEAKQEATMEASKRHKRKGHGRMGVEHYSGAKKVICEDEQLSAGQNCPVPNCGGRLYDSKQPQQFVRFAGRPLIDASIYEQQVLRCAKCQARFAAPLPSGVKAQKYDESADAMMAIMKYGASMPFYRMASLEAMLGIPLPATTIFERCEVVANELHAVFLQLQSLAANAPLLHTDDTGVRILSCIKENKDKSNGERKGLYTTGIAARNGDYDIVLYYSGRKYAGENLARLVVQRSLAAPLPIVMADAGSRTPQFNCIIANCLAHARRKFIDCEQSNPAQCKRLLDDLAKVYHCDAQTSAMSPAQRLAYHQQHSAPIMDELQQWCEQLLEQKIVEPNSALGKAITYMLKHWPALTQFLTTAGAPLDNNFLERMLRRVVINRKNWLFFCTEYGATIGDVLTSIIETCRLNKVNPFDYLINVMRNSRQVRADAQLWLPWNYHQQKPQAA